MKILVLGAYGLIGLEVVRALRNREHEVVALGRSEPQRPRLPPDVKWVQANIATLTQPDQWSGMLTNIDAVVNAAGALQDGMRDDLEAIHHLSIAALVKACEESGVRRLVQISAPGARPDAATEFMRSKSRGDEAIRRSGIEWVILRPGLVLTSNAYGGSAMLRMVAAMPWVEMTVLPEARIQTASINDVCECVCAAVDGRIGTGVDIDVLEAESHSLAEIARAMRVWMGLPRPRLQLRIPRWVVFVAGFFADGLAYLGWRSPLRTNALKSLEEGVTGDAGKVTAILGRAPGSMAHTLAAVPSTLQERWFARLYLMMPMMVTTLAAFWIVSGVVGFLRMTEAAAVVVPALGSASIAKIYVVAFSVLDIALGIAALFRSCARRACGGMIALSLLYLLGATILTPELWLDPLGPLVKVIPGMMLALVTMAVLEER